MNEPKEERVTVVGPADVCDFTDASTGVRFVQGRAENVPMSVARVLAKRKGNEITTVFYVSTKRKDA